MKKKKKTIYHNFMLFKVYEKLKNKKQIFI